MISFLQWIAAVMLVQSADSAGGPATPRWALIAATVLGYAVLARAAGLVIARRAGGDERRPLATLLYALDVGRVAALVAFWLIMSRLGGARVPHAIGVGEWPIVPRLLQFAPFVALIAALPWGLHPAAAALRVGSRSALGAAAQELRDAALPATPILLWIALDGLQRLARTPTATGRALSVLVDSPALYAFFTLGMLMLLLLAMPFILRLFVRARPLPAGTLRARLEAYSRRVGFRARDILIWPTGGDSLNAAVVGAFPRFRYVFVTDGLLKTLDEDEIEAVFAHEAGHARRGHVLLFLGFTAVLGLMGFVPGLSSVLGIALGRLPPFVAQLVLIGVWWGVVMGWVSRRFEQEADVFGIETLPRPEGDVAHPFARALTRIGEHVGEIREMTGWRHFSIDDRVAFVRAYLSDPEVRRSYRRSIALVRGTLLLLVCGFALSAAARIPGELSRAPARLQEAADPQQLLLARLQQALLLADDAERAAALRDAGFLAVAAGRPDDAAQLLRESAALAPGDVTTLVAYASLLERTGRPLGARLVWKGIAEREDVPEDVRALARMKAEGQAPR